MDIKYWLKSEGYVIRSIDDWSLGENLEVGDVRINGGAYFCVVAHLTAANYEPGTGADWEDVFKTLSVGLEGPQGIPGGVMDWKGAYDAGTTYATNDGVRSAEGRSFYALQETTGNAPPSYPDTDNAYWDLCAEKGADGADGAGGASFWTDVPGSPTRVSDTQFTITDPSNANKYDKVFTKGTILQWLESTTFNTAMVTSASYGTNTVTINIVGDSLTAGFTAMKYCIHRAQQLDFILPGTIAVGTDLGRTHYATCDLIKLAVDVRVKTAGATNATTIDINDDGSTIITTKPSISNTGTSDIDNVCDAPTTVIAAGSAITLDVDAVTTTAPVDLYATLYVYPEAWRYIA